MLFEDLKIGEKFIWFYSIHSTEMYIKTSNSNNGSIKNAYNLKMNKDIYFHPNQPVVLIEKTNVIQKQEDDE